MTFSDRIREACEAIWPSHGAYDHTAALLRELAKRGLEIVEADDGR